LSKDERILNQVQDDPGQSRHGCGQDQDDNNIALSPAPETA